MDAERLLDDRYVLDERSFAEMVVWRVPQAVPGCSHDLKYRLAYLVEGECVLRYDNEAGKGDHRHWGDRETEYTFVSLEALQADFWTDVDGWEKRK
ncbi:MAG: hypothetical protein JO133_07930 [Burkholderiaceae bacterium]|nr:hypothetical protein [Burkholderiaceae bacterium]